MLENDKLKKQLRFKDENGNDYPEWEVKKLGEITFKTGIKNKDNISYPVYSINNKEGFLPQSEQFDGMDSSDRGYDISMYKIIKANTFAYNPARINVGSIGYSGDLDDVIISSLYVCFKTTDEVNDAYLMVYLKSDEFNKSVLSKVEGGVRNYLFYENFSGIEIPLPSISEQIKIANFLSSIDEKTAKMEQELQELKQYKKGVMQLIFDSNNPANAQFVERERERERENKL